ncbi:hypothetical protein [Candidatus Albibeggiatoa sp. nov. BB20]|uniref:hypothetical protein n=1 Tax=Candidatus Albibeggiatoa sp. nov. BB20 TaxID=3162723 RepID=UPI0033653687
MTSDDVVQSDIKVADTKDSNSKETDSKKGKESFLFVFDSVADFLGSFLDAVLHALTLVLVVLLLPLLFLISPVTSTISVSSDFHLFKQQSVKEIKLLPSEQTYFEQQLSGQVPKVESQHVSLILDVLQGANTLLDFSLDDVLSSVTKHEFTALHFFERWFRKISEAQSLPEVSQLPIDFRLAYIEYFSSLERYLQASQERLDFVNSNGFFDMLILARFYLYSDKSLIDHSYVKRRRQALNSALERFKQAQLKLRSVGIQYGVDVKTHFPSSYQPIHQFEPFKSHLD